MTNIKKKRPTVTILTLFWKSNVDDYFIRYYLSIKRLIECNRNACRIRVVLFDNSPEPTLKKYISINKIKLDKRIFYLEEKEIGGFAPSNNYMASLAIKKYNPDYLFFLNPDTEIQPDAIKNLVKTFRTNKNVFAVEAKQHPFEHPKEYNKKTLETSWNSGACVLVDAKRFKELGGFDSRFFMYAEDVDLSWRAWERGYKCLYQPKALCVHHCYGPSKNQLFRQYWNIRNGVLMRFKHGNIKQIIHFYLILWKYVFNLLRRMVLKEALNVIKAVFSGSITAIIYLPNLIKRGVRPNFANFYQLEYAKHK